MPYNLNPANPSAVLPQSLSTSFVVTRVYPLLTVQYNDGTYERSIVQDGVNAPRALRTWILAKRLDTYNFGLLFNFWDVVVHGGQEAFYFYDPTDVLPGQAHGSNYDPSGGNNQGRATVFFRGDWAQKTELGRHTVPSLTMVEVA